MGLISDISYPLLALSIHTDLVLHLPRAVSYARSSQQPLRLIYNEWNRTTHAVLLANSLDTNTALKLSSRAMSDTNVKNMRLKIGQGNAETNHELV